VYASCACSSFQFFEFFNFPVFADTHIRDADFLFQRISVLMQRFNATVCQLHQIISFNFWTPSGSHLPSAEHNNSRPITAKSNPGCQGDSTPFWLLKLALKQDSGNLKTKTARLKQSSAAWMANAVSPHRLQQYALATDEQENKQTDRQRKEHRYRVKPPRLFGGGLKV